MRPGPKIEHHHIKAMLYPISHSHSYSLKTRTHNTQLPDRLSRLADCNSITRMLFYQSYWHSSAFIISFTVNDVNNCVFVCSNAVYIWLWCCNCGLPVIYKWISYVMLCIKYCRHTIIVKVKTNSLHHRPKLVLILYRKNYWLYVLFMFK